MMMAFDTVWTLLALLLTLPLLLDQHCWTTVEASFLRIPSLAHHRHKTNNRLCCNDPLRSSKKETEGTATSCQQKQQQRQRTKCSHHLLPEDHLAASVWVFNGEQDGVSSSEWHEQDHDAKSARSVQETWNWCTNFVVPLNLCPWAASSVTTPGAVQLYVVPASSFQNNNHRCLTPRNLEALVETVAHRFITETTTTSCPKEKTVTTDMTRVAIAFLVLEGSNEQQEGTEEEKSNGAWYQSFPDFYEWFTHLEDSWIDRGEEAMSDDDDDDANSNNSIYNSVTLAAFHPEWEFGGGDSNDKGDSFAALNFEKKSPHPTISMVWTAGIDAAGPEATERIGLHNEQLLQQDMTLSELQSIYHNAVLRPKGDGVDGN